ncbi:MAG TPA: heme exporter protein CcmD [Nitrospira sp.]|nr:heme exporter protein CcmD [Nitrospira sp.]
MMQWNSLSEFLAMGGYGFYVWTSFGVTGLCMAFEVATLRRRYHLICQTVRAGQQPDKEHG